MAKERSLRELADEVIRRIQALSDEEKRKVLRGELVIFPEKRRKKR